MNRWRDWLDQAKRDLEKAELDINHEFFEWACFTAQQSAEKAIKALGMKIGVDLWGHSLTEMLGLLEDKWTYPRASRTLPDSSIDTTYPRDTRTGLQAGSLRITLHVRRLRVRYPRLVRSSGSARAVSLNRDELLKSLKELAEILKRDLPWVKEVMVFGSLARGEERGTSDVDILVLVEEIPKEKFWEVYSKVFDRVADTIPVSFDLVVLPERDFLENPHRFGPTMRL